MKLLHNSYFRLYIFIIFLSSLLTLVIYPLFPDWFNKYKAQITEDPRSIPNPFILYHDFDHDGFSEMAALKYQNDIKESALKIYAYNGGLIDQWKLDEPWIYRSMFFGDYNHDGHDETYVFTKNQDSLFLYIVNPENAPAFEIRRLFIFRYPSNKNKFWDIRPIDGVLVDVDNDGSDDLIFNVMAGYALQPRNLFCISIKKHRLLYISPKNYSFIANPILIKYNKKYRILMKGSVALSNAPLVSDCSDASAWLMAFTPKLRYAFPPYSFKGPGTELVAFPFHPNNDQIITLVNFRAKSKAISQLMLFDWNGNKLIQKELVGSDWHLMQTKEHGVKRTILINPAKGLWAKVNKDLQINWKKLNRAIGNFSIIASYDLDNDFNKEIIATDYHKLIVMRHDFTYPLKISIPNFSFNNLNVSLRKNGGTFPDLYVQGEKGKFFIKYLSNPLYSYRIFLPIAIFLLLFLFLQAILHFYNIFIRYKNIVIELLKSPDRGILILDAKGKIRFINHTMIDQFHFSITDFKGKDAFHIFENFQTVTNFLTELLHSCKSIKKDLNIKEKSITIKGEIYGHPIISIFHIPIAYFIEINDYTKPLEEDRLRSWSKTVQKMAHDIKAPLSSININLTTLNLKLAEISPEMYSMIQPELNLMMKEVKRVKEKTISFLKFTNLEPPKYTWIPVKQLLDQTLVIFKSYSERSIRFNLDMDDSLDRILVDEQQIKMALQAIIENAIDAIRGQGTIYISTNKIVDINNNFNGIIEIEIADSGPGIPESIKDKIFEPYFTTKKGGTGMGLAIARKIVLEHKGELHIYSTENFATVVKIMLPIGNTN